MLDFCGWLLSVVAAFFIGTSAGANNSEPADSELQQKIQAHMDVIVDESAGMIDDVAEEARKNRHVREAEGFIEDVKEIAQNTADDIEAHFGSADEDEAEDQTESVSETADTGDQTADINEAADTEGLAESVDEAGDAEDRTESEDDAI